VPCSARRPDPLGARHSLCLARVGLVACFALVVAGTRAVEPPSRTVAAAQPEPPRAPAPATPTIHSLDDLKKLPPGAVIVVCPDLKEGLRRVPTGVLLTPDEYQKLLDQAAQLRAATNPDKPAVPSVCRLTGQVKDNLVLLKVQFEFPTSRPNTTVALGCTQGKGKAIALDGKTPLCQFSTEDGYVIQVEKPGDHQVTLELEVGLVGKGAERGFDLDLPRSPITSLDLDLGDPAVKEVHLTLPAKDARPTTVALAARPADGQNRVSGLLGALGRLDLAWKRPAPPPGGPPLLAAEGHVVVRLAPTGVLTEMTFHLKALRGQTSQWRFLLPPGTRLLTPRLPDERVASFEAPDPKNNPWLHILRLKASASDPLAVDFQLNQPRAGTAFAVGPFAVLGALPHTGTLLVTAPADMRLTFQPRGEPQVALAPRALADEDRRKEPQAVAAFTYRTLLPVEARGPKVPPPPPFLLLDVETVKEACATKTVHRLQLTDRGWKVTTDLDVRPLHAGGVDRLEVQVPPGYEEVHRSGPARPGQHVELDAASGTALVTLSPKKTEPFHVTLEALYLLPGGEGPAARPAGRGSSSIPLPVPRQTRDLGAEVSVSVPRDIELEPPRPPDPSWERLHPGQSEYTWTAEHTPERVTVAWRVNRPEVTADCVADVTLTGGQVQVRERLVFPTPTPDRALLWVPEKLVPDRVRLEGDRARVLAGEDAALPKKTGYRPWLVQPAAPPAPDHPLVVLYSFALDEPEGPARRFALPLILPESASRVETVIHLWTEPGARPVLVGAGSWEEIDEVGDRDVLPALSLRGRRPDQPPVLRVSEPPVAPPAAVLVERALVQVRVAEGGSQSYRVRLLLNHVYAPHLDVQLPAAVARLNFKAFLLGDGRGEEEATWQAVDDSSSAAEAGRVVRLPIPSAFARQPLVLDLTCELPAGRAPDSGPLLTTLVPPALRGDVGRFPVRYQVRLPAGWVPLMPEDGLGTEQRWGWRGWLLGPLPSQSSSDLERWLFGGFEARFGRATGPGSDAASQVDDADPATLVCARSSLAAVRLVHFPLPVWLAVCSLTVLAVAFLLYVLALAVRRPAAEGAAAAVGWLPRALFWPLAGGLGFAVVLAALFWPGVLGPVLYGAEPGALVLAAVLAAQWGWQQRYRRQVVFLPGFTRVKQGSSLVRNGSSNPASRPRGEPSTVDAPPPGSSNAGE
jgi:hypothetical protein